MAGTPLSVWKIEFLWMLLYVALQWIISAALQLPTSITTLSEAQVYADCLVVASFAVVRLMPSDGNYDFVIHLGWAMTASYFSMIYFEQDIFSGSISATHAFNISAGIIVVIRRILQHCYGIEHYAKYSFFPLYNLLSYYLWDIDIDIGDVFVIYHTQYTMNGMAAHFIVSILRSLGFEFVSL